MAKGTGRGVPLQSQISYDHKFAAMLGRIPLLLAVACKECRLGHWVELERARNIV